MALKNYPATTESIALLQNLGEKMNVPMQIYTHHVSSAEEKAILHNASNKHPYGAEPDKRLCPKPDSGS